MKKISILILLIIIITGCQANYNIEINKEKIYETITIETDSNIVTNATQKQIDNFTKEKINWEYGYEFYNKERYNTDTKIGYKYTYDFNYTEYNILSQISKCYDEFIIEESNSILTITTSDKFICSEYHKSIPNISINISSEYQIESSNADKQENSIHTWNITQSNYQKKPIQIKINKNKLSNNKETKKIPIKIIIVFTLFIILIIISLIIRKDIKIVKKS